MLSPGTHPLGQVVVTDSELVVNAMTLQLTWRAGSAAAVLAAAIAALTPAAAEAQRTTIRVDGSSTVFPITQAVAEEFQSSNRNVRVTVGVSGTGGGFKKFCIEDGTHISNASRPIKPEEIEACAAAGVEFIELPVAYDALSVVVSEKNDFIESMTVEELRRLWAAGSDIDQWSDLNPDWPAEDIELYGPGSDSGTFDYFTEEVIEGDSRTDYTPSEDDNVVVRGVSGSPYALGYFGLTYYINNQDVLRAVAIDGGEGPVYPSVDSVNNGTYTPLSRPIYIYVNKKAAETIPELRQFVEFYLENAPALVEAVDYVPLPDEDYAAAMERFASGETGREPLRTGL